MCIFHIGQSLSSWLWKSSQTH